MVHTPLRELNFGGQKSDSTVHATGKRPQQQRCRFAGPSLYGVKMKILKKVRILAGLFDKHEARRNQLAQQ